MSNYVPLFYIDVITYTYPNPDSGLLISGSKCGPYYMILHIHIQVENEYYVMGGLSGPPITNRD